MNIIRDWVSKGPLFFVRAVAPDYALRMPLNFIKWGPRHPKDGYYTSFEEMEKMCFVWVPKAPERRVDLVINDYYDNFVRQAALAGE